MECVKYKRVYIRVITIYRVLNNRSCSYKYNQYQINIRYNLSNKWNNEYKSTQITDHKFNCYSWQRSTKLFVDFCLINYKLIKGLSFEMIQL